jgi:hypothetical protein
MWIQAQTESSSFISLFSLSLPFNYFLPLQGKSPRDRFTVFSIERGRSTYDPLYDLRPCCTNTNIPYSALGSMPRSSNAYRFLRLIDYSGNDFLRPTNPLTCPTLIRKAPLYVCTYVPTAHTIVLPQLKIRQQLQFVKRKVLNNKNL